MRPIKTILFTIFSLIALSLFAQEASPKPPPKEGEKGVSPISSPPAGGGGQEGATYAVVVGISDYQDEDIPDLRFADKDALAFATFLQSPAGGSLDEDHLKVLTNDAATSGQFASALYWLMDECKEGDQAIIYFSGHGDVESQTFSQPGYLLCWDAPSKVYMAGGTLAIPMFQLVVSTLSLEKKARVVVITDACRAGKLAGSAVNGSKLTSSNLSEQFANELKILSCQPDEYSIEGEQWGGGRGAFSYHLVDGLYGLADGNEDLSVNLMEVGRYLQDRVSVEVAPHNQLPMTVGNPREVLATVDDNLLERVKQRKEGEMPMFTATETRGIEEEVLSLVDSTTRERYQAFQSALADQSFFEPENACAEYYFNQLIEEPLLAKLHAGMRRNYAAGLQDDAQQVINKYLTSNAPICIATPDHRLTIFSPYPGYLQRAIELLGEDHYMTPLLQARKLWFEGALLDEAYRQDKTKNENPQLAIDKYKEALTYQPDMALALVEIGFIYGYPLGQLDSADLYFEKALELCPNWLYALFNYGLYNLYDKMDYAKAKICFDQMMEVDSNSALSHTGIGQWHKARRNFAESIYYLKKSIELYPTFCSYSEIAAVYLRKENLQKAAEAFEKAIEIDPNSHYTSYLGMLYAKMGRLKEAEKMILETRKNYRPSWCGTYINLSQYYFELGQDEKAREQFILAMGRDPKRSAARWLSWWSGFFPAYGDFDTYFKKVVEWFPDYPEGHYEYAVFLAGKGAYDVAFQRLEKAFALGYKDFQFLTYEGEGYFDRSYLAPLREMEDRWNELMNQYNVPAEYRK